MSSTLEPQFGAFRSFFWPIYPHELRKIVPMIFILFFICFNYAIVRNMKDSLVVTVSGAEVIPFIKVWVMLPSAVLLTLLFSKLCNIFSQERVFYIIVSLFLAGFALFGYVLYPNREALMPVESVAFLQNTLPAGFKGLISMYQNWTLTACYVMSELWGSMVLVVLFWGFANEVTPLKEAKRFYSVFPIWLNIATITASQISNWVTRGHVETANPWDNTLSSLVGLLLVSGVLSMIAFWLANRYVFTGKSFEDLHSVKKEAAPKGKKKISFRESIAYVSNSKYLVCIAIVVVAYNLVINLVEVVWKDQLRLLYPLPTDYNTYMNNLTTVTAILASLMALLIPKMFSGIGWTKTAMVTPILMFVTSLFFFFFLIFQNSLTDTFLAVLGMSPLFLAVFFGSAQNVLSKTCKYSVYDATKEMAYIPLSHDCKLKGKAAIDGVGSRLGKSGGSLIHQGLLMVFVTLSNSAPYVAAILMIAIFLWILAVKALGVQFNELTDEQKAPTGEPKAILTTT